MVARQQFDRAISILSNSQFNYNYGTSPVDTITEEMARDILGFSVEKRPCYTEDGIVIPRMNYLRRSDGGIVDANCSVGEEFEVTSQPLETLEIARFIMANVPDVRIETIATMYNGGTTAIVLSQGGKWMVKGDSSPHFLNCVLNNPLTRGKIHIVQSMVRVVCENTLAYACKSGEGYRISHTTNARALMQQALEGMRYELGEANKTRQMCEFLATKSINTEQVNRILDLVYPLPTIKAGENTNSLTRMQTKRDEVVKQFESDDSFTEKTFYTFLNSFTYNIEHPLHKQARTDSVQVAFENMTGGRAEAKSKILARVLSVAMNDNDTPMLGNGSGVEIVDADYTMVA